MKRLYLLAALTIALFFALVALDGWLVQQAFNLLAGDRPILSGLLLTAALVTLCAYLGLLVSVLAGAVPIWWARWRNWLGKGL